MIDTLNSISKDQLTLDEMQDIALRLLERINSFCKDANIEYYLIGGSLIGAVRNGNLLAWDDDIDIAMKRRDYERFCREFIDDESSQLLTCSRNASYRHGIAKLSDTSSIFIEPGVVDSYGVFVDVFPLDEIDCPNSILAKIVSVAMKVYNYSHVINVNATSGNPIKNSIRVVLSFTLGRFSNKRHLDFVESLMKMGSGRFLINYWGAWGSRECVPKECFDGTVPVIIRGRVYQAPKGYDEWLTSVYGDYMTPPKNPLRNHGCAYRLCNADAT